jgi:hypothetical protein
MLGMNKLPVAKRVQILSMLCEGSSMRSISRVCDVSINTVSKLFVDAGKICIAYHDQNVRGLRCKRVQCDEIWSFSKLIVSWAVGGRDAGTARDVIDDLQSRVKTRMQITTDGLRLYLDADRRPRQPPVRAHQGPSMMFTFQTETLPDNRKGTEMEQAYPPRSLP